MRTTSGWRRALTATLLAATIPTAGCLAVHERADPQACGTASTTSANLGTRIQLLVDSRAVHLLLEDTPPARDLAARLPLQVELEDRMGAASVAELPEALVTPDGSAACGFTTGDVVYWADTGELAIIHSGALDGESLRGATRLGTVTDGLRVLDGITHATPAALRVKEGTS